MGMRPRLTITRCLLRRPATVDPRRTNERTRPGGHRTTSRDGQAFVAEGRTVVLSSHLLDEIERTCDAVAIVDAAKSYDRAHRRPVSRNVRVQIECSTPGVRSPSCKRSLAAQVTATEGGLRIVFASNRLLIVAEVNRVLVDGGVSVYRLQLNQASLESWFLEVTTRLGASHD